MKEKSVFAHVLVLDLVVIQQVLDDATQEDDVGAGAYGRVKSATDAERVKRGSTTMSFALLWALASVTHLNPQVGLGGISAHDQYCPRS